MDRAAIGLGAVFLHLRAELNFHRLFNEAIEDFSVDGRRPSGSRQALGARSGLESESAIGVRRHPLPSAAIALSRTPDCARLSEDAMADHGEVEYATAEGNDLPAHEATYENFVHSRMSALSSSPISSSDWRSAATTGHWLSLSACSSLHDRGDHGLAPAPSASAVMVCLSLLAACAHGCRRSVRPALPPS